MGRLHTEKVETNLNGTLATCKSGWLGVRAEETEGKWLASPAGIPAPAHGVEGGGTTWEPEDEDELFTER